MIKDYYIFDSLNKSSRVIQFEHVQSEAKKVFVEKNTDYGDSFSEYGIVGVLIRINDKIRRYINIEKNGFSLVKDETFKDTLLDLHNYSALALILLNEEELISDTGFHKRTTLM